MRYRIALLLAVVAAAAFVAIPGAPAARNSEQVVFSGVGPGNTSFFGFWIWCEADSQNPYAGVCSGAMYFYDLGITKHVFGSVTELSPGVYRMNVFSSSDSGFSVACTLWNGTPVTHGPSNTVNATCSSPSGFSGQSTNAVVNVTGP